MGARTDAARAEVVAARDAFAAERKSMRLRGDRPGRGRHPGEDPPCAGPVGRPGRRCRLPRPRRTRPGPRSGEARVRGEHRRRCRSRCCPMRSRRPLRELGADGDAVRGALERSFAEYLDKRGSLAQRERPGRRRGALPRHRSSAGRSADPRPRILARRPPTSTRVAGRARGARGPARDGRVLVRRRAGRFAAEVRSRPRARRQAAAAERSPRSLTVAACTLSAGEWRNGRRAGLRSRCRVSGVSVRPRPRLPGSSAGRPASVPNRPVGRYIARRCTSPPRPPRSRPCCSRSSCRRSASTTRWTRRSGASPGGRRVAGFRPGKAPRFMLERVLGPRPSSTRRSSILLQDAYREALVEQGIVPLTQASVDVVQAERGQAVQVHGDRPGAARGDPRRLPALQLRARDRAGRRRQGPDRHRRAARPERHAPAGRGPAGRRTATTR